MIMLLNLHSRSKFSGWLCYWFLFIKLDNFILIINSNEDQFVLLRIVTGQNERQGNNFTGQLSILAGHCPFTGPLFRALIFILYI